ncbi:hypothetical protein Sjap_014518 [Stephania japonica]|uniref:Uncharacterized protein n=1 Tax=Stephania japonica TaxID=461633 RepID=A0AAP0NT40_9MAGN
MYNSFILMDIVEVLGILLIEECVLDPSGGEQGSSGVANGHSRVGKPKIWLQFMSLLHLALGISC